MPSLLARTTNAIKALTRLPFPRGGSIWGWRRFDNLTDPWPRDVSWGWRRAGDAYDPIKAAGDIRVNPVVAICKGWMVKNLMQARLVVLEENEQGVLTPVPGHPLVEKLKRPNKYYGRKELLGSTASDFQIDGNAYWIKIRNRAGEVTELWWAPVHMMKPVSPQDGGDFISHYVYTVNGTEYPLDPNDVVHFRYPEQDPTDPRLGISPLKALYREIGLDNSIATVNGALAANGGQPGIILVPKLRESDPDMTEEEAKKVKHLVNESFTGDNAGKTMVLTFEAQMLKPTFSPEEMKLDVIGNRPEARICAAFGIQAAAVGLSVGEEQRSYANTKEMREGSWEECVIPMLMALAEDMTRQLLPDFDGDTTSPASPFLPPREVGWDYSQVRALREDEDAKSERAIGEWQADGLTFNEFREKLGQVKLPDTDSRAGLYYSEWKRLMNPEPPPGTPESQGDRVAANGNGRQPVGAGSNR